MAHHCDNGIIFRHRWAVVMFCIISMTFQVSKQTPCSTWKECDAGPGTELEVVGGVDNKMVNLTVTCDRDAAHLNFSTGGLRVISLRLAQNCTFLGRRNSSGCDDHAPSPVLSFSTSQREGWEPNVSPPSNQHPSEVGLECQYFGCYYADPDDALYIYTFPTATCTFSAQSRVQSLPTATSPSPVLSSTLVKPTTYSPYMDYPYNINANSTGKQIGGRGTHWLLLVTVACVTVMVLLPIPLCLF